MPYGADTIRHQKINISTDAIKALESIMNPASKSFDVLKAVSVISSYNRN